MGQPAARRAREASLQGGRAQRALDNGHHGVPHPRREIPPLPDNRLLRRRADKFVISTSLDSKMTNSSLLGTRPSSMRASTPKGHSNSGRHCRRPGRIRICDDYGIVRSMLKMGCSRTARAEGFFERLKIEFFYDRG